MTLDIESNERQNGELKGSPTDDCTHVEDSMNTAGTSYYGEKSKAERRLLLKQDLLIPGAIGVTYFFAYLDRGAIGNARIMGFQEDLGLTDDQFYNCLLIFFIGYALLEGVIFYLIRHYHVPSIFAGAAAIFGTCSLLTAYATTYAHVLVLRFFIGITEATVQTGIIFTSLWYRREEMSVRASYIFALTPVAGAVAGLISYGVQSGLEGALGHRAWQWLFIIEGAATLVWAVILFIIFPQVPEKELASKHSLWFRDPEERRLIVARSAAAHQVLGAKVEFWQMKVALKDIKVYLLTFVCAVHSNALTGFSIFLPTFVHEFGFSPLVTQLYTIIPYGIAFISLIVASRLADHYVKRAIPALILTAGLIAGMVIILAQTNPTVGIVASSLVTASVYPGVIITIGWIASSNAGYTKRATATWMGQILTQAFSIMTSKIYDKPPRFFKGHGVLLGFGVLAFLSILVVTYLMRRHNKKQDDLSAEWEARGEVNPDQSKSIEELCDDHPSYRYLY